MRPDRFFVTLSLATLALLTGCNAPAARPDPAEAPILIPSAIFRPERSREVLRVDFESGSLSALPEGVHPDGPPAKDAFSIATENPRSGKYCLKVKVAAADDYISYGAHRAETHTMNFAPTTYNEGDVFRYRFSFKLTDDWQVDSRDCIDIVWQFKRFEGGPDMFVAVKGKDIVLRVGSDGQSTLVENYSPGLWMDFCITVRWSATSSGVVEACCRTANESQFRPAVTLGRSNTRDNRPNSTYLTWGIYKPGDLKASVATKPRIIYYDDIVVERAVAGMDD